MKTTDTIICGSQKSQSLNEYTFNYQRKVMVWQETTIYIEASSQAEAEKMARLAIENGDYYEFDIVEQSEEEMTYEENNNEITEELYDMETGFVVYDNTPIEIKRNEKISLLGI